MPIRCYLPQIYLFNCKGSSKTASLHSSHVTLALRFLGNIPSDATSLEVAMSGDWALLLLLLLLGNLTHSRSYDKMVETLG